MSPPVSPLLDDGGFILYARNLPESRKFSRTRRRVTRQAHQRWYPKHMKEFRILECGSLGRIGYLRIRPTGEVGLVILPRWQGQGYGVEVLRRFSRGGHFRGPHWARIHRDNTASLLAFLRAGWHLQSVKGSWVRVTAR